MSRILPQIEFAGIPFFIDIESDEFRQVANPDNRIHFDLLGEDEDGQLLLFFDRETLNVYPGPVDRDVPANVEIVSIRSFISMDPVGVARKCDLPDDFFLD